MSVSETDTARVSSEDTLTDPLTDPLTDALYGEDSWTRDRGRAVLIRSGSARDIRDVVNALCAPLPITRRRATRVLSELQPPRALTPISSWLEQLATLEWCADGVSAKALRDGLVSAARLLNQLTPRGERAPDLTRL